MPKQVIVCYMPVLHRGYLQFFDAFPEATEVYIIDRNDLSSKTVDYLRKDVRQLEPQDMVRILTGLNRFDSVSVLGRNSVDQDHKIFMPAEDISYEIAELYQFANVTYHNTFLRWDRRSLEDLNARHENETTTNNPEDVAFINQAISIAQQSTDIWRRVGAVLIDSNKKVINLAANTGESTLYSPWIEGDPRNAFNRGVGIEMSVFTHAEAVLIANAAKHGISLDGTRIYVTDFPCPACAKLIAHSGISHVYYKDGYAVLDGKRILDDYSVTLTKVTVTEPTDPHPEVWVPYVKN